MGAIGREVEEESWVGVGFVEGGEADSFHRPLFGAGRVVVRAIPVNEAGILCSSGLRLRGGS